MYTCICTYIWYISMYQVIIYSHPYIYSQTKIIHAIISPQVQVGQRKGRCPPLTARIPLMSTDDVIVIYISHSHSSTDVSVHLCLTVWYHVFLLLEPIRCSSVSYPTYVSSFVVCWLVCAGISTAQRKSHRPIDPMQLYWWWRRYHVQTTDSIASTGMLPPCRIKVSENDVFFSK